MAKRLSTIAFNPMVEAINRKFARRIDTVTPKFIAKGFGATDMSAKGATIIPGHSFMGASSRIVNINGIGAVQKNVMFFRKPWQRTTPLSEDEITARTNFGQAASWTKLATKSLSVLSANRAKYNTAKEDNSKRISGVGAYGYSDMRGWIFAVAVSILNNEGTLSQDGALPAFDA